MRDFKVKESIEGGVKTTLCGTFEEASRLMLKINKAGGKSYMTSFEWEGFDNDYIVTSRPTLSPEQRRYERTGRL